MLTVKCRRGEHSACAAGCGMRGADVASGGVRSTASETMIDEDEMQVRYGPTPLLCDARY
eukprot:41979-Rhodomonas_salina.4